MNDRVVRDPIYGYVSIPFELTPIVDSVYVQRLRRVCQTSMTSSVYPSATGTRFEHALGTMHLAAWAFDSIEKNSDTAIDALVDDAKGDVPALLALPRPLQLRTLRVALAGVGLLHDVGHPPFSHVLEPVFEKAFAVGEVFERLEASVRPERGDLDFHERVGEVTTHRLCRSVGGALGDTLLAIYKGSPTSKTWAGALHSVVADEIDVDRLDYLLRDAQRAGTEFGAIDFKRLMDSLLLVEVPGRGFSVVPAMRARSAFETLLIQREQAYRWVSFHPRVLGANQALADAVELLYELGTSGRPVAGLNNVTYGDLFDLLRPNLNYLCDDEDDLERALRPNEHLVDRGTPPASGSSAETLLQDLQELLCSSADDASILEWLKRGLLLATALREAGGPPELERFRVLAEVVLYRRKHFLAAWKSPDEYEGVAKELLKYLKPVVKGAYAELIEREPGMSSLIAYSLEILLDEWRDSPSIALNRVLTKILLETSAQRELRGKVEALSHTRGLGGFWAISFPPLFKPLKTGVDATRLWDGGQEVPLTSAAPLAADLARADERRPRLNGYYFDASKNFGAMDEITKASERRRVRDVLRDALGSYLEGTLPSAITPPA